MEQALPNDFQYENTVSKIIRLIESKYESSPLLINGAWGTGKTTLCKHLEKSLSSDIKYTVKYIDSFRYDHTDDPYLMVLSKILGGKGNAKLKNNALAVGKVVSKSLLFGTASFLIKDTVVEDIKKKYDKLNEKELSFRFKSKIKEFSELEENIKDLKKLLIDNVEKDSKMVVIIDELDRCKPSFALDTLEIIKHIFDLNNYYFVIVTNKDYLEKAIKNVYGIETYSAEYLQKFYKYSININNKLNETTSNLKSEILFNIELNKLVSKKRFNSENDYPVFAQLIKKRNLSLRDIKRLVLKISIAISDENFGRSSWIDNDILFICCYLDIFESDIVRGIFNSNLDLNLIIELFELDNQDFINAIKSKDITEYTPFDYQVFHFNFFYALVKYCVKNNDAYNLEFLSYVIKSENFIFHGFYQTMMKYLKRINILLD